MDVYMCEKHWIELLHGATLASIRMHAWKKGSFNPLRVADFGYVKHVRTNKLCMEPFLLRYACGYECVLTLGTHFYIRACTKNLRRVSVWQSKSVNIWAQIQSKKIQKLVGLRSRNHILAVLIWVHCIYSPPKPNGLNVQITSAKTGTAEPNSQQ